MIHLNTKLFRFYREEQSFVAEASDLDHEFPTLFDHDKIELISHKTGACKTFTYRLRVVDDEGDTLYWEYKSDDNLTIKILND